jgi:hypothetical protein
MAGTGKERFCPYGKPAGHFVVDTGGWIFRIHGKSMTKRAMCPACQAVRKLPKAVLDRMTEEERAERREMARGVQRESMERKK